MAALPFNLSDTDSQDQSVPLWDEVAQAYADAEEADRAARQAWAVFREKRAAFSAAFAGEAS
jgi:hypothetical protein